MKTLNEELVAVLGAEFDWAQYIASIAAHRASKFTKSAIMDDIVTDVTGDILIAAKDGTLAVAIAKAKEAETPAEVLHNVKGVVMQATKFRVSDAVRWTYRTKAVQFSQIEHWSGSDVDRGRRIASVQAKPRRRALDRGRRIASVQANDESDLEQYKSLIVNELGLMAQAADRKKQTKLARRLRLAATVVSDRVDGFTLTELQEKYKVKSSSTMQAILDDIGQALARVAGRLQDPTLLRGTAEVAIA